MRISPSLLKDEVALTRIGVGVTVVIIVDCGISER